MDTDTPSLVPVFTGICTKDPLPGVSIAGYLELLKCIVVMTCT
jgi:hypothetical protein